MKVKEWGTRIRESELGRIKNLRPPIFLNALILLALLAVDVVAVKVGATGLLAALCAYLSALTLLVELLEQAFFKGVGTTVLQPDDLAKERNKLIEKWLAREPLSEAETRDAKLQWKQYFVVATFFWYVGHVRAWLRKALFLLPRTVWLEDRDNKADTYLLRFWAFVFLLLAINFDILRRVFS